MPPRTLKSIAASVAFPAFVLGHDPSRRIICVSYSGDLAKKNANEFRAGIEAALYRSAFPSTRGGPYKNSETEIELTARGFRLATSVGGTLTGRGGDIIVIDDPLKPDDALSETQYQQAPAPPGGAMVKRAWIRRFSELPLPSDRLMTLQSWDTASKGGPENDWSVCTTWILAPHKRWYLVDVWRRRVDYPALKTAVQALAKQWDATRVLVEDVGAGTSLVQELK